MRFNGVLVMSVQVRDENEGRKLSCIDDVKGRRCWVKGGCVKILSIYIRLLCEEEREI